MALEWTEIEQLFKQSRNKINLIMSQSKNDDVIEKLCINKQSVLGQVLIHLDSVVVNDYLKILGRDEEKNGIVPFNEKLKKYYQGNKMIVAYDVWGGLYAIGNGDFEGDIRSLWYYAPDLLQWESLQINYAEFVVWACSENIKGFYESFLCNEIEAMLKTIHDEEAILIYPFLWSNECDIEKADKKIVPVEEIVALNVEFEKKLS